MFAQVGWPGFWIFAVLIFLLLAFFSHILPDSWWPDWFIRERGIVLSCTGGTLITSVDVNPKFELNTRIISVTIYLDSKRVIVNAPGEWTGQATIVISADDHLVFSNDPQEIKSAQPETPAASSTTPAPSAKPATPATYTGGEINRVIGIATITHDQSIWKNIECRRRSLKF
jgi:hypothetical protein